MFQRIDITLGKWSKHARPPFLLAWYVFFFFRGYYNTRVTIIYDAGYSPQIQGYRIIVRRRRGYCLFIDPSSLYDPALPEISFLYVRCLWRRGFIFLKSLDEKLAIWEKKNKDKEFYSRLIIVSVHDARRGAARIMHAR